LAAGLVDIKDGIHYLFKRMFSVPRLLEKTVKLTPKKRRKLTP